MRVQGPIIICKITCNCMTVIINQNEGDINYTEFSLNFILHACTIMIIKSGLYYPRPDCCNFAELPGGHHSTHALVVGNNDRIVHLVKQTRVEEP